MATPRKPAARKGRPTAADFAPKDEIVELPSGRDIALNCNPPSLFALAQEGALNIKNVNGEHDIDEMEFASVISEVMIMEPPLSFENPPPEGYISYSWLTTADLEFITTRYLGTTEEVEEENATFRPKPTGAESVGDSADLESAAN